MSQFVITGGRRLSGTIPVYGSKNAALPLLAASLLTSDAVNLDNIPPIADVDRMLELLQSMKVDATRHNNRVAIKASAPAPDQLASAPVGLLRGSILLMGALLGRVRSVQLPLPGGDIIGARPINVHLDAFRQLGARITTGGDRITIDGSRLRAGRVVLGEFSVTATENVLLTAASLPGTTTIEIAAAEPHVVALANVLQAMGATITGAGTHTIVVQGRKHLGGASFTNIPDMLEAGFFILLAAATQSAITVTGVPADHLLLFFKKLDDIGIHYTIKPAGRAASASVTVMPGNLTAFHMQSLPFPGIATDLQAPFAVVATQAHGSSLIHDPLYEDRFKHIVELQKMGAKAVVCDPHRVIITGPTPLTGRRIPSLDIRAGATLVLAGLVAQGQTVIDNAEIIDRGYFQLAERLASLGAGIQRNDGDTSDQLR